MTKNLFYVLTASSVKKGREAEPVGDPFGLALQTCVSAKDLSCSRLI